MKNDSKKITFLSAVFFEKWMEPLVDHFHSPFAGLLVLFGDGDQLN